MKINKRVIGMIIGFTMVFTVGCNKTEKAESLIKENIENTIERNLEEYSPKYNDLGAYQRIDLDYTKGIENIDVKIEEQNEDYKIKLILDIDDEGYKFKNVYTIIVDKDDFKDLDLKETDLIYNDNIEVVAVETNCNYLNSCCIEGYEGDKDGYLHWDKDILKDKLLLFLGDISKETMVGEWEY